MNKALMPLDANGKLDLTQIKNGVLLLTFDDSHYETWLPMLDLFDRYNARATFFHFADVETEVQRGRVTCRGHTAGKQRGWAPPRAPCDSGRLRRGGKGFKFTLGLSR